VQTNKLYYVNTTAVKSINAQALFILLFLKSYERTGAVDQVIEHLAQSPDFKPQYHKEQINKKAVIEIYKKPLLYSNFLKLDFVS
jgi:hypothetical protein